MDDTISTQLELPAKRPRCSPQSSVTQRYNLSTFSGVPESFNSCMYSEEDIGWVHWNFGKGYEKHPFWKVLEHETIATKMVVQWWDVACHYGSECKKGSSSCPFDHSSEAAEWKVVGEYWRRRD